MSKLSNGLIQNYGIYGKILETMIEDNLDDDGNIIDQEKNTNVCAIIRQAIDRMDARSYDKALDIIAEYADIFTQPSIRKVLNITHRFIVGVEKEPLKMAEFRSIWEKYVTIDESEDTAAMANIKLVMTSLVHDYLLGVG